MAGIRFNGHNFLLKSLINEDLAGADNWAVADGAVRNHWPVRVHLDMDVDRSFNLVALHAMVSRKQDEGSGDTYIEPREDCSKRCNTLFIGRPHAAKESCVVCWKPLLYYQQHIVIWSW